MRRSIRLPSFDYAGRATYFVTLVSANRVPCFATLRDGQAILKPWGSIVEEEWLRSPSIRDYVELDAYVIMPDQLHVVVRFTPALDAPAVAEHKGLYRPPRSLGSFVARFKASCTRRINLLRGCADPPLWQRNYYETIIRDQLHLDRVRRYIEMNPRVAGRPKPARDAGPT